MDPGGGLRTHEDRANHPYLQAYEDLLWALMREHLDYHIVDTDILAEAVVVRGQVRAAGVAARVVVVPAMPVVELSLATWLADFTEVGGIVVCVLWMSLRGPSWGACARSFIPV